MHGVTYTRIGPKQIGNIRAQSTCFGVLKNGALKGMALAEVCAAKNFFFSFVVLTEMRDE